MCHFWIKSFLTVTVLILRMHFLPACFQKGMGLAYQTENPNQIPIREEV